MYILPIEFATPAFDEALRLRDKILRKPLQMEFFAKDIALEWSQFHLGYYTDDHELLGVLTLLPLDEHQIKMRQVAVDDAHHRKGIGQKLVHASEQIARENGFKKMVLHARQVAVPFYEKLDYQTVGDEFLEVNIPHFKMEKNL